MGLPKIDSYILPTALELPAARVAWTPDRNRTALLIHDMQNYFVNAFNQNALPIDRVVEHIGMLRDQCDTLGIPVFYSAQPGNQDPKERGLQADFWGPGMRAEAEQQAIIERLAPRAHHTVLTKWRYSAFQRTNFESLLQSQGRDQLIVTGVYAHIGCSLTAADAFMRDIQPFFVADAVGDFSREKHQLAIQYVSGHCAVVMTTNQVLEAL